MKRAFLLLLALAVILGAQTTHSVTLTWPPNTSGDPVAAYNVLRGTTSGGESSTPIGTVPASSCTSVCTYVDSAGLVEGQTYFYEQTATDAAGKTSLPSPEVTATIPFSGPPNAPAKATVVVK